VAQREIPAMIFRPGIDRAEPVFTQGGG
jgi:hypothetical protein